MEGRNTTDSAAAARRARFGTLPERIRREDLVEEKTATVNTVRCSVFGGLHNLFPVVASPVRVTCQRGGGKVPSLT